MASLTDRSLDGPGTDESVWSACTELRALSPYSVRPPDSGRVVVVAPHPDDEVLGAGGTIASLATRGTRVFLVAVTDGEASAPERAEELRRVRPLESARAAATLGATPYVTYSLRLPDGRVRAENVEAALVSLLEPSDLVLAPWAHDGHPDHDQVGMAAELVCQRVGASFLAYLVWAWHWAQPSDIPWEKARRVELDDATAWRKREAVQCFTSQLTGPEPILSAGIVRRLTRDFEVFLAP
jgi:LmbE family N-acetylglucosaminyl deacetylase